MVVPTFDEVKHRHACLGLGFEACEGEQRIPVWRKKISQMEQSKQSPTELIDERHPTLVTVFAEGVLGVLTAVVGVLNHPCQAGVARAPC